MEGLSDEITAVQNLPSVENLSPAQTGALMRQLVERCDPAQLVEVLHVTLFTLRDDIQRDVRRAVEGNGDLMKALQRHQDVSDALRAAMTLFVARPGEALS